MSMEADDMFNKVLEELLKARENIATCEERERHRGVTERDLNNTISMLQRNLEDHKNTISKMRSEKDAAQPKLLELHQVATLFSKNNYTPNVGDVSRLCKALTATEEICTDGIPF